MGFLDFLFSKEKTKVENSTVDNTAIQTSFDIGKKSINEKTDKYIIVGKNDIFTYEKAVEVLTSEVKGKIYKLLINEETKTVSQTRINAKGWEFNEYVTKTFYTYNNNISISMLKSCIKMLEDINKQIKKIEITE